MTDKGRFIREVNEAFARNDLEFLAANITDDFYWYMVGDRAIHGKRAVVEMMKAAEPETATDLTIHYIITHGILAVAEGELKMVDTFGVEKVYAFCDIYKLDKHKDGKIKEMTSYVIEKEEEMTAEPFEPL